MTHAARSAAPMHARALLQLEAFGTGRDKVLACGPPADRKATFLDLVGRFTKLAAWPVKNSSARRGKCGGMLPFRCPTAHAERARRLPTRRAIASVYPAGRGGLYPAAPKCTYLNL